VDEQEFTFGIPNNAGTNLVHSNGSVKY